MKNSEAVMRDVALTVRAYENGKFDAKEAVYKVLDLVSDNDCRHCAYNGQKCREDHTMTCGGGFDKWLGEEL